ncbi:hypothetical protein NOR53_2760 [gamma proteobacterium NOR5-3]|nr:hypothetical protein NOR53_2760 [gamma proteobacterium NOR5-3]
MHFQLFPLIACLRVPACYEISRFAKALKIFQPVAKRVAHVP